MAATNINRVVLTGNLTRDPELRSLPSGMSVCSLRIASNTRRKENGEWVDKPNYFSVTVWGAQGENCSRFLSKGRPVAIDGRLEWREWTDKDGNKRESVEIVADAVQFLGGREEGAGGGSYSGGAGAGAGNGFAPHSDVPADMSDFVRRSRSARATPLRRTTTSRSRAPDASIEARLQGRPSGRPCVVNGEHTRERRVKQLAAGGACVRAGVGASLLDPSLRVRLRAGQGGCRRGARRPGHVCGERLERPGRQLTDGAAVIAVDSRRCCRSDRLTDRSRAARVGRGRQTRTGRRRGGRLNDEGRLSAALQALAKPRRAQLRRLRRPAGPTGGGPAGRACPAAA